MSIIIDGSDNFKTKFLINDYCIKLKKKLVTGAISKFDGHIFTFNFNDKKTASLKDFYQEKKISDDILNCEFDGVLGTTASIVGTTQANEALKMIMEIGQNLKNQILIMDLLNLNFRKIKFKKIINNEKIIFFNINFFFFPLNVFSEEIFLSLKKK